MKYIIEEHPEQTSISILLTDDNGTLLSTSPMFIGNYKITDDIVDLPAQVEKWIFEVVENYHKIIAEQDAAKQAEETAKEQKAVQLSSKLDKIPRKGTIDDAKYQQFLGNAIAAQDDQVILK